MIKQNHEIEPELAIAESATPPQELLIRILAKNNAVTVLPEVATKALEMVQDMDTSIQSLATLIQQDVRMATDILSIANSVIYSPSANISSLEQAITRLGFEQCKNVILGLSLRNAMQSVDLEQAWISEVLTRHSLLTGMIAADLNRRLAIGLAGEEFAAGLVHDFGRLLLASAFEKEFAQFDPLDFQEPLALLEQEYQFTGSTHCEVGAWFLSNQGLPSLLCNVSRYHHQPQLSDSESHLLCVLTAVSDHMANHYQRFAEAEEYDASTNPFVELLDQDGVRNAAATLQDIAPQVIAASVENADRMEMGLD